MKALYFLSLLFLFSATKVSSQTTSVAKKLYLTIDCADSDGIISEDALPTCHHFLLKGTDKDDYIIVSFEVSMVIAGQLRTFPIVALQNYSDAGAAINALEKGKTMYLDKVKVKNTTTNKIKTISSSKVKVE